jgi:hypothetical protein
MAILDNYLYGTSLEQLDDPKLAGDVDRSAVDLDIKKASEQDETSTREDEFKDAEDMVIHPNSFIPVISNQKFEFVPY